jgi:hypothetical protein
MEAVEQKRYLTYNSQHITTKEIETYDPKISYMGGEVFAKDLDKRWLFSTADYLKANAMTNGGGQSEATQE